MGSGECGICLYVEKGEFSFSGHRQRHVSVWHDLGPVPASFNTYLHVHLSHRMNRVQQSGKQTLKEEWCEQSSVRNHMTTPQVVQLVSKGEWTVDHGAVQRGAPEGAQPSNQHTAYLRQPHRA